MELHDRKLFVHPLGFDREWYLLQNPDVAGAGVDPLDHYLTFGAVEGRDPNAFFDSAWYLAQNPDVPAGTNPLVHFLHRGMTEGRRPNRLLPANLVVQDVPKVDHFAPGAGSAGSELFNAFWHGPPLSAFHWACLNSFVRLGHRVHLYSYQQLEVPPGVERVDAGEIIAPQNLFFFNNDKLSRPDVGPFTDVFRFKLLFTKGGWWVDADVLCNQREFPECRYAWAVEEPPKSATTSQLNYIGTSQIKFPKDDPIVKELYRQCSARFIRMKVREEIGPRLLTEVLTKRETPAGHFGTNKEFYPIKWLEALKLWMPQFNDEVSTKSRTAYFVPCWGSLASYVGIDLNRNAPAGSYMADVFGRLASDRVRREPAYSNEEISFLVRDWLLKIQWAIEELSSSTELPALEFLGLD